MTATRADRIGLLVLPGLAYLGLIYALPLFLLLLKSFRDATGAFSVAEFVQIFGDPLQRSIMARTLRVAFLVTLLALVIAWPTAIVMRRAKGGWLSLFLVAMILPMSLGVVVKAFAWSILFRTNGFINQAMMALGLTDAPVRLLFTETALVIGAANVFLPFMVLPIYAVLQQQDPNLPDAAATLGAGPYQRFFKVILPLALPGVVAGCAFVFSMAVSMYVIPSLIIGERQQTVAMQIARSFLFLRNEQLGSSLSTILLLIAVSVVLGSSWLAARLGARQ
ncbi:MAG: ABC transporter permease [Pararhodobacter sp.]|nr:ABC transporter permease [Pararhodobacter sp.]